MATRTYPAATAQVVGRLDDDEARTADRNPAHGDSHDGPGRRRSRRREPPGKDKPVAGSRSLGDPLLPQLGNGGYDVKHYRIELDYDPAANRFDEARTTIRARATKTLSEFSLDFQDDLEVTGVTVGGRPAQFGFEDATPQLSDNPAVTQPRKLVVTPHPSTRPKVGTRVHGGGQLPRHPGADHRSRRVGRRAGSGPATR